MFIRFIFIEVINMCSLKIALFMTSAVSHTKKQFTQVNGSEENIFFRAIIRESSKC